MLHMKFAVDCFDSYPSFCYKWKANDELEQLLPVDRTIHVRVMKWASYKLAIYRPNLIRPRICWLGKKNEIAFVKKKKKGGSMAWKVFRLLSINSVPPV